MECIAAVDLGNTRAHIGLFGRGAAPDRRAGLLRWQSAPHGECAAILDVWRQEFDVRHVGVASVNPPATDALRASLAGRFELIVLGSPEHPWEGLLPGPLPRGVGGDRIANAIGAFARTGGPCIVADCGTAITIEVVGPDGRLLGGAIAPGMRMGALALSEKTKLLPEVEICDPVPAIGDDTEAAIASGLYWGFHGLVLGLVEASRRELGLGAPRRFLGTGGDAELLLEGEAELVPTLTLEGVALALERRLQQLESERPCRPISGA